MREKDGRADRRSKKGGREGWWINTVYKKKGKGHGRI
jgi:hypothetical protein